MKSTQYGIECILLINQLQELINEIDQDGNRCTLLID